ncbi:uncharacterized protein LOC123885150 [Trifolium pratense]|uniref:Uncharacterized protein n=1 Tax=Trifolium pratense TaxID=57577 RepID=A0ACB0L5C3_TRIPR|nr:uncharacterized protein LOC123885150 [Trifolium pratense]CAJ2663848.1 unnamed protein product [Trifolium pratense]
MAKTSCPIELEPRTLNEVELSQARELAAEVVQKLEPNEASALFVEGIIMHPIKEEATIIDENESHIEKLIDITKKEETITHEEVCQCQCSIESQSYTITLKEPLSAPF